MKQHATYWLRQAILGLTATCLLGACLGLSTCQAKKEDLEAEQPRANAIAESRMPQEEQQKILAGSVIKLHPINHLRFGRPDMLQEVVRRPAGIDKRDFYYSLYFDQFEGVYWVQETIPNAHGPRWYGPLPPNARTIKLLTPDDYLPPPAPK